MFIAALFIMAPKLEIIQMSSNSKWIKCGLVVTMEYYSAVKKNELLIVPPHKLMSGNMMSEISQRHEVYHCIISFTSYFRKCKSISNDSE